VFPVWTESSGWLQRLYATHLDSTGGVFADPFWQPDSGSFIGRSRLSAQADPAVISDGWGGAVIAWAEQYAEYGEEGEFTTDIYAQRIFDYASGAEGPNNLLPRDYALHQNYPNPFNPTTTIAFDLPLSDQVRLAIYDLLGREVAMLVDGKLPAGEHAVIFDAATLPSGLYIYRLTTADFTQSRKLVLLR
jgi:hypothetical protein